MVRVGTWGSCLVLCPHPDGLSPKLSATPSQPNSVLGWSAVQLRGGRGGGRDDGNQTQLVLHPGTMSAPLLVPGKILGTGSPAVYSPGCMRPQIQRCRLEWAVWACWGEAGRGAPVCPGWLRTCCWSMPWLSQALTCQPASGAPGLPEALPGRARALARWAARPSGLHVHSSRSELRLQH